MDTPLTAGYDVPKSDPRVIAQAAPSGVAEGRDEVLADENGRQAKQLLSGPPSALVFG